MLRQLFTKPSPGGPGEVMPRPVSTTRPRAKYDCQGCALRRRRSAVNESPYDRPCVDLMMSIIEGRAL